MRIRSAVAPLTVAAGLLLLAGCTGGTTADQSVSDACRVANETMSSVQSDLTASMTGLATGDISGALEVIDTLQVKLDEAQSKVGNADVESALAELNAKIAEFDEILGTAGDGGVAALADNEEALSSVAADIQAAGQRMSDLCS